MTRPITVLQPEQLTDLRLLASGATRRHGVPWRCALARLRWFEVKGLVVLGPSVQGRRTATLTELGRQAIAAVAAEGTET